MKLVALVVDTEGFLGMGLENQIHIEYQCNSSFMTFCPVIISFS
ncbi:hypothetical protein SynROS8604_00847 [Synechococcus sp. ROS8604]|nr:hypothetical protein SynROS8604_00847 [Synechococcus sp. ROS8604]